MAWVAEATFEGLSNADLNGQGGGTGWSGNWSGSVNFDVQASVAYDGSQAVTNASGSNISRSLTTAISTDGNVVYFAMRKTSTSAGVAKMRFTSSAPGIRAQINMDASGNITAGTTGGTTVKIGYSADTWYVFEVTLDVSTGTYDVNWSTDAYGTNGSFTAGAADIALESTGDIDGVQFDSDTGDTKYWDYISGTSPFTAGGGDSRDARNLTLLGVG